MLNASKIPYFYCCIPTDSEPYIFFSLCHVRKKTCGPVTKCSHATDTAYFSGKIPKAGKKHLFPMVVMPWNEK